MRLSALGVWISFAIHNVSPAPIAGFNYNFPAECVMASFLGKESVMEQRVWEGGPTSFFSSPTITNPRDYAST